MKYLISESKLKNYVLNLIETNPNFNNLKMESSDFFDYDLGVSVNSIDFKNENDEIIMEYIPEQEGLSQALEPEYSENFPILRIDKNANLDVHKIIMNDLVKNVLKNWFEEKYQLPVDTIYID